MLWVVGGWVGEWGKGKKEGKKKPTNMTLKQKQLLVYLERQNITFTAERSILSVNWESLGY